MIRVLAQPEPADFSALVRAPGQTFLAATPRPTAKEFEKHPYWRRILRELRLAYGKVCAYSSFYVPSATGVDTVEHYLPKVPYPEYAYEWSNYRFVCHRLNTRKSTKEDVVDPFAIENGWFVIEFPSLLVKPGPNLDAGTRKAVADSIIRVGLNDSATCWEQRDDYTRNYCLGIVTFQFLVKDAPFLAAEIQRQGLVGRLNDIMNYPTSSDPDRV